MQPIQVMVQSSDVVSHVGITALLSASPEIEIVDAGRRATADVIVIAERRVGSGALYNIRGPRVVSADKPGPRCVVVTDHFEEQDIVLAVRCGVMSILPAQRTSKGQLIAAVLGAVRGQSLLPRPLQAALLRQLNEIRTTVLEPHGLTLSRFLSRERETIRLVADGFRTDEIATQLHCSEGTVKSTLYGAMRRLGLNNRAQAVAYAIRSGAVA